MALIKTNPGDSVKITLNDNHTEAGIIMPSSKEAVTIIKLSTGYNVGFENKDIKDLKLIKKAKESSKESKQSQVPKNKNLPKISILHTGGTIASKVDYKTGGVVALFEVEDLLRMVPELEKIANVKA